MVAQAEKIEEQESLEQDNGCKDFELENELKDIDQEIEELVAQNVPEIAALDAINLETSELEKE